MRFFAAPQLLVIDELGYLPLPPEAASALFQVISRRYLTGSVVLTTNRGVTHWGELFDDATISPPRCRPAAASLRRRRDRR